LAGRVRPDAEAVEAGARRVIARYEPAISRTDAEGACVVVAKSAGHAVRQRRLDRTAPSRGRDGGRRACRAAYCAVVDAAVLAFVMQSVSRSGQILDLAISRY
jgi:hypothetical protein